MNMKWWMQTETNTEGYKLPLWSVIKPQNNQLHFLSVKSTVLYSIFGLCLYLNTSVDVDEKMCIAVLVFLGGGICVMLQNWCFHDPLVLFFRQYHDDNSMIIIEILIIPWYCSLYTVMHEKTMAYVEQKLNHEL